MLSTDYGPSVLDPIADFFISDLLADRGEIDFASQEMSHIPGLICCNSDGLRFDRLWPETPPTPSVDSVRAWGGGDKSAYLSRYRGTLLIRNSLPTKDYLGALAMNLL